jgi:hypothetical protein
VRAGAWHAQWWITLVCAWVWAVDSLAIGAFACDRAFAWDVLTVIWLGKEVMRCRSLRCIPAPHHTHLFDLVPRQQLRAAAALKAHREGHDRDGQQQHGGKACVGGCLGDSGRGPNFHTVMRCLARN